MKKPFETLTKEEIDRYLAACPQDYRAIALTALSGVHVKQDNRVFISHRQALQDSGLDVERKAVGKRAIRFQDLRHYCATRILESSN